MEINNENGYRQNLERLVAIKLQIINLKIEYNELERDAFEYQGSDTYNNDRGGHVSCEMRSREFENFKSEKGVGK